MQMLLAAMLVDAAHAALKDAEKALYGVAVDAWRTLANILASAVRNKVVRCVGAANGLIESCFVSH